MLCEVTLEGCDALGSPVGQPELVDGHGCYVGVFAHARTTKTGVIPYAFPSEGALSRGRAASGGPDGRAPARPAATGAARDRRDGDLQILVLAALSSEKEVDRPACGDIPRSLDAREHQVHLRGPPRVLDERVRIDAALLCHRVWVADSGMSATQTRGARLRGPRYWEMEAAGYFRAASKAAPTSPSSPEW